MSWHILDTGSIWLKEFAFALGELVPTHNWSPEFHVLGHWQKWKQVRQVNDPRITMTVFPLQRGYARFPVSHILPFERSVVDCLRRESASPKDTGLICTAPFYAPVAERWPGPVVYYLTDLTKKYDGMNEQQIVHLDRRMCKVAETVCPNSERIASYLREEAGCSSKKISVIPNATRAENVFEKPPGGSAEPPLDMTDLPRPIIGIIGNLAANMDWLLLSQAVKQLKDVSWAFIGPSDMKIADPAQQQARQHLLGLNGRIRFVGQKPYSELCQYARAFDMALLPYKRKEPTYSGSATRFYEHLAACRPIVATRGFHELLGKEPLLKLVDDSDELEAVVEQLRMNNFCDGVEELRWRASREGTWSVRARDLLAAANHSRDLKVA